MMRSGEDSIDEMNIIYIFRSYILYIYIYMYLCFRRGRQLRGTVVAT